MPRLTARRGTRNIARNSIYAIRASQSLASSHPQHLQDRLASDAKCRVDSRPLDGVPLALREILATSPPAADGLHGPAHDGRGVEAAPDQVVRAADDEAGATLADVEERDGAPRRRASEAIDQIPEAL